MALEGRYDPGMNWLNYLPVGLLALALSLMRSWRAWILIRDRDRDRGLVFRIRHLLAKAAISGSWRSPRSLKSLQGARKLELELLA
ncbi:unnamed protein product [Anisakis simplex]|uniref:Bestrophin homolog n=1 Tax=Anisakis simplex TaxID=6269 RepID=A0A0M3KDD2_ANISI|nr:unnamed protein product [Anisakis simplex]